MASFPSVRPTERPADAGQVRVLGRPLTLAIAALLLAARTAAHALSELATLRGHDAVHITPRPSTSTRAPLSNGTTWLVGAPAFARSDA
jgi:hypothetical protein